MRDSRRVFGEFVLIVVGVLAALWAQGFADRRAETALADEYLTRLVEGFRADSVSLALRADFFRAVEERGRETLAWLDSESPGNEQTLVSAFLAAERWPLQPASSTYEDLKSTGNLALIEDLELRALLSDYYAEAAQRQSIWDLPQAYRTTVRGIVPLELQQHVARGCGDPKRRDLDLVVGSCSPSGLDPAEVVLGLEALRDAPGASNSLRHLLAEMTVGIRLYDDMLDRATALGVRVAARR